MIHLFNKKKYKKETHNSSAVNTNIKALENEKNEKDSKMSHLQLSLRFVTKGSSSSRRSKSIKNKEKKVNLYLIKSAVDKLEENECDIKRDTIKEIVKLIFALNLFNDNTHKAYCSNICFSLFFSLEITICPSANQMALNIKDSFRAWMATCAMDRIQLPLWSNFFFSG